MNTPITTTLRSAALAALSLVAAASAVAGGSHAGGHGHDDAGEAIGQPGVAGKVSRTIAVDMNDAMRFTPDRIAVKQNETVRFVFTNSGKIKHEWVLGTEPALKAHGEAMKKNPGMEHQDPGMVTLAPGQRGELVWQFTQAGTLSFACLQPGHDQAGMKGGVTVASASSTPAVGKPARR